MTQYTRSPVHQGSNDPPACYTPLPSQLSRARGTWPSLATPSSRNPPPCGKEGLQEERGRGDDRKGCYAAKESCEVWCMSNTLSGDELVLH